MPVYWTDEKEEPKREPGDIPAPPGQEEEEEKHHPGALCHCEICQSRWVGYEPSEHDLLTGQGLY